MKQQGSEEKLGLILSVLFHLFCVVVALWGFWSSTPRVQAPYPIPVNIVTLGPQTIAPRPRPSPPHKGEARPEAKAPEPPQPLKTPTPEPQPAEPPAPAEIPESPAPLPKAPKEPLKKPKPSKPKKAEVKPADPVAHKPQAKPKSKPKPQNKTKPKAQPKENLDTLLKDLESVDANIDDLMDTDPNSTSTDQAPIQGNDWRITAKDLLNRQFTPCWNLGNNIQNAKGLCIGVDAVVDRKGYVTDARLAPERSTVNHPHYQAAAQQALSAVRDPRCNPIPPLPQEAYADWKDLKITLKPNATDMPE